MYFVFYNNAYMLFILRFGTATLCVMYWSNGHMTFIQRRLNVDATSWRCIDVEATLYWHNVPAGEHRYKMSHNARKRTFGTECPAKIQISLRIHTVWSESLLDAFWIAKDATFLHADNELWSDCADVQADLSLVGRIRQKVRFLTFRFKLFLWFCQCSPCFKVT